MILWEVTQITGGTYTGGTDWSAQFNDETVGGFLRTWQCSAAGELHAVYATAGRRARMAVLSPGPATVSFYIENNGGAGSGCQLQVDGVIIGEYLAGTSASFPLLLGVTKIELIWKQGTVIFASAFVAPADSKSFGYATQPMAGSSAGGAMLVALLH